MESDILSSIASPLIGQGQVLLDWLQSHAAAVCAGLFVVSVLVTAGALWCLIFRRGPARMFLALAGVLSALFALQTAYLEHLLTAQESLVLGVLGYAVVFCTGFCLGRVDELPAREQPSRAQALLVLSLIVVLALPARVWELEKYGKVLHTEHMITVGTAVQALQSGESVYLSSMNPAPEKYMRFFQSDNFFADPLALVFLVFGKSVTALKIIPILFGIATIAMLFFFMLHWFGLTSAAVSALFYAVSPYIMGLNREVLYHHSPLIAYALLTLHFLLLTLERPRFRYFFFAGALAYFSFYLYFPAWILFPLVLGAWCFYFLVDAQWREQAAAPMFYGALYALPVLFPFLYLVCREDVYHAVKPLFSYMHDTSRLEFADPLPQRLLQAGDSFLRSQFFFGKPTHFLSGIDRLDGSSNALHQPLEAVFFFLGLGLVCRLVPRSRRCQVLLTFFLLAVLPGFLSVNTERRYLVEKAAVFVLAGLGGAALFAALKARAPRYLLVQALALSTGVYLLSITGLAVFADRARSVAPFLEREAAQIMAREAEDAPGELMVTTWWDYGGAQALARFFLWDGHGERWQEVEARFFQDQGNLRSVTELDFSRFRYVRFFLATGIEPSVLPAHAVRALVAGRTRWKVGEPVKLSVGELYRLRVPMSEVNEAVETLCLAGVKCRPPRGEHED